MRDNKFVWIVEDITQLKRLEQELRSSAEKLEQTVQARTKQLQEAIEVKSRFLAIMSHEIRTPLNGIICGMNLLAESKLSAEQSDLLRTTLICSEQLLYVINDILGKI
jgi:signal transduction histidine kinase